VLRDSRYLLWDIISSCAISNHFWLFGIFKHSFCFVVFFVMQMFDFLCFSLEFLHCWRWINLLVWMWCTIQGISILCVVNVVTMMVIGADIRVHNITISPPTPTKKKYMKRNNIKFIINLDMQDQNERNYKTTLRKRNTKWQKKK